MSESAGHGLLVSALLKVIHEEYGETECDTLADMPLDGRFLATFQIERMRPDIFVRQRSQKLIVIGEAKTASDIDNSHTRAQLKRFYEYLLVEQNGLLWLSVPLNQAGEAHRLLRHVRSETRAEQVPFRVSGWILGGENFERRWNG